MQVSHEGVQCDECSQYPVLGVRYKCGNCADYDLCERCEKTTRHNPAHVFIQLKDPLPDVYADMHTPLLSVNVYQSRPVPSPLVPPVPRVQCQMAVRKACKMMAPPTSSSVLTGRTLSVTIKYNGAYHYLSVQDTDTVGSFLGQVRSLGGGCQSVDLHRLASSVSSGTFRPATNNSFQNLAAAGLTNGTVIDLSSGGGD